VIGKAERRPDGAPGKPNLRILEVVPADRDRTGSYALDFLNYLSLAHLKGSILPHTELRENVICRGAREQAS
jgi:hypothetical protein